MLAAMIQRASGWLPNIVAVLLVVVLADSLAEAFWMFYPATTQTLDSTLGKDMSPPKAPTRAANVANLIDAHLFGRLVAKKSVPAVNMEVIPDTTLRLVLKGVVFDDGNRATQAIIAEPGRRDKPYRVGDELPGGAELTEIHPQRIILKYRGQYETLRLNPGYAVARVAQAVPARSSAMGRRIDHSRNSRMTRELGKIRDSFLTDPQTMVGLLRAIPVQRRGRFEGFRLAPGRDRGFLKRFGLRTGDIVKSINGIELDSPAKALGLLGRIPQMQHLQIEIVRGNSMLSYVFNVGK